MSGIGDMDYTVLVNKGSASAAEIFAGALQDYKIADVLGTTTFVKVSDKFIKNLAILAF